MGLCLSAPNADTPAITDDASADTSVRRPDEVVVEQLNQAALLLATDSSDSSDDGSLVANEELDAVEAEPAVTSPLLRPDRADQKYKEAVAAAVEKCADDTKGQTCYICTQVLHWKTKEGLVSGFCACRGDLSFAHVSCLAEQAQVVAERTFDRWHTCRQCEQEYHGVVRCALGWACWKTYLGRPEADQLRGMAMHQLGKGLFEADHFEDALSVQEAELSTRRRLRDTEHNILCVQGNLAITYDMMGQLDRAQQMMRDVYCGSLKLFGEESEQTLVAANNYADSLLDLRRFEEAKSLLCKTIPVARSILRENHHLTLVLRNNYAWALYMDDDATLDDLHESVNTLEEVQGIARRVLGAEHPTIGLIEAHLRTARVALVAREMSARMEDASARPRETLARKDRLERAQVAWTVAIVAEARRRVAELRRTAADAEAPP